LLQELFLFFWVGFGSDHPAISTSTRYEFAGAPNEGISVISYSPDGTCLAFKKTHYLWRFF